MPLPISEFTKFFPVILVSLAISLVCIFLAIWLFKKINLLDNPQKYGLKREPIPYSGGLAIFFGVLITLLITLPLDKNILGLIGGLTLITLISFLDDRYSIAPIIRLVAQISSAGLVLLSGLKIESITNPLGGIIDLTEPIYNIGFLTIGSIILIAWIITMMNAVNFLDGIPGLVSGVSAFSALILLLLAIRPDFHYFDQTQAATLAAIILGASLAFLLFDFYPPKILMGDTGTMGLGFLLAITAVLSGAKIATAFLVLGVPIFDAGWTITRRLLNKKSPFKGDFEHFHHRLLAAGFSKRKTIMVIYIFTLAFGASALILESFGKLMAVITLFVLMTIINIVLHFKKEKNNFA